jgi:hypothetical protein
MPAMSGRKSALGPSTAGAVEPPLFRRAKAIVQGGQLDTSKVIRVPTMLRHSAMSTWLPNDAF